MQDQMLTDAFEQLIAEQCDLSQLRRIEAGESTTALWAQIHESGFVDALVPATHDGAGLGLREAAGLIIACGYHALPLPLPQTMLARAHLAHAGRTAPAGSITFADRAVLEPGSAVSASGVPFGLVAEWVWIATVDGDWLLPAATASRQRSGGYGSLAADLGWPALPPESMRIEVAAAERFELRAAGAALTAGLLAGALGRAVEKSIGYANDRVQFGKPIGKLQAIQQQLSVASEQLYAARSAALIGLSAVDHRIDILRAAAAKSRASEAVVLVAAICHGVHGAIGITEEYDLQLFTRRLHEWRRDYGSETYWNGVLGNALLEDASTPLEFIRARISPAA